MAPLVAAQPTTAEQAAAAVDEASIALVEMTFASLSTPSRLTVLQARVLVTISEHGSMNLQDLAVRLAVSTSSASRLVDRLEAVDLLRRRSAAHSRREITLSLTPQGQGVLAAFHQRRRQAIYAVLSQLSRQEQAALVSGLRAFSRAASS